MRFYNIEIKTRAGKTIKYTSLTPLGGNNGSALRVDLDVYQQVLHETSLNSWVRIYGISYKDISQIADLNPDINATSFAKIRISVGMGKGLPFANPKQAGLVIDGVILQSFANWEGNEISLDLILGARIGSDVDKVNIPWEWKKGTTLESAVRTALGIGFKGIPITGSFSPKLIYTQDEVGQYTNGKTFANQIYAYSKAINTDPKYFGASIIFTPSGILLTDGTAAIKAPTEIKFTDIIGNLTWLNVRTIQAKLVMRGDLNVNDKIKFPKGSPVTNVINSFSQYRNNISFQGEFVITKIHHMGNNRQADAKSWVTVVDCVINEKAAPFTI